MKSFVNFHPVTIAMPDGKEVTVRLRLTVAAQYQLAKKWKSDGGTVATLLNAIDDLERLVDVLDACLKYPGDDNAVHSGEEMAELLLYNGELKPEVVVFILSGIGRASRVMSDEMCDKLEAKARELIGKDKDGEDADTSSIADVAGEEKNA